MSNNLPNQYLENVLVAAACEFCKDAARENSSYHCRRNDGVIVDVELADYFGDSGSIQPKAIVTIRFPLLSFPL